MKVQSSLSEGRNAAEGSSIDQYYMAANTEIVNFGQGNRFIESRCIGHQRS